MNVELSHREAKSLFFARADDALDSAEEGRLREHLDRCGDCRAGWDRYARAVQSVRRVERERAPEALASVIVRRARRRRPFDVRGLQLAHAHYRFPAEAIIPLLLGVALAALLMLIAP